MEAAYAATVFADYETRSRYIDRVERIAVDISWVASGLSMIPFYQAWISGDMGVALEVLDGIVDEIGLDALQQNQNQFSAVRSAYLTMGKLEKFQQFSDLDSAMGWMELIQKTDSGDTTAIDLYLETAQGTLWDAMLLAWTNQPEMAEVIIHDPPPLQQTPRPYFMPNFKSLALGELAIANDNSSEAVEFLNRGLVLLKHRTTAHYLFGLNALARAQLNLQDINSAIETLKSGSIERDWSIFEPGATFMWIRNRLLLMDLLAQQGRLDEAGEVAGELRTLYSVADEDHPVRQLIETM